jgi:uncharacterized damage-inducible protein DinB
VLEHFLQLFTYDDWANREAAAFAARAARPPEKARKILAHILGAEWLWYARISGTKSPMAVWPELDPEQCAEQSTQLFNTWREYLSGLGPAGLGRQVEYRNSKGEPWTSTIEDILMHVVMHSAYHRGQIATLLRDSGHEPAYTDFIHAVRQGLL